MKVSISWDPSSCSVEESEYGRDMLLAPRMRMILDEMNNWLHYHFKHRDLNESEQKLLDEIRNHFRSEMEELR